MQFQIFSRDDITSSFGNLGLEVGTRVGANKRTHDQKEWYCLRRYLFLLAEHDLVHFPLEVSKGERPDFVLSFDNKDIGIEVTEATTEEYQRELTNLERHFEGNAAVSADLLEGDGWVGNSAEQEAASAIIRAIDAKLVSILSPDYRRTDRYEVLVYLNVRAFFAEVTETLKIVRNSVQKSQVDKFALGLISASVIFGECLIYDLYGESPVLLERSKRKSE